MTAEDTFGTRLRTARQRRGWSQQQLADAAGISQQSVGKIENGKTETSRYAMRLARALEIPLSEIDPEAGANEEAQQHRRYQHPKPIISPDDAGSVKLGLVSVFALSLSEVGQIRAPKPPIGFVSRCEPLRDSAGAYALYVAELEAAPVIEPGDTILVNPDLPPLPGTDCVFWSHYDELRQPRPVRVRRLVAQTDTGWRVRQFNPDREYEVERAEFETVHRIVAIYRRQ